MKLVMKLKKNISNLANYLIQLTKDNVRFDVFHICIKQFVNQLLALTLFTFFTQNKYRFHNHVIYISHSFY